MLSYIIISLLIIFVGVVYSIHALCNKKELIKQGGYQKPDCQVVSDFVLEQCKIIQPNYINASALLKDNYYVFNITDARIITFPIIRTYYLRTKKGLNCFEAICPSFDNPESFKDLNSNAQNKIKEKNSIKNKDYYKDLKKNWGVPIILDIIKYHGRDVKTENFEQRLKYIKELCTGTHLSLPTYSMFNHTKQFGEQFSKILNHKESKMIMFKAPNKRYFHPHASYKWISPSLLEIIGVLKTGSTKSIDFCNKTGQYESLINDEFPLTNLIHIATKKHKSGKVRIYIKNNEPSIEAIAQNQKITLLNDAQKIWIQMNKGLTIEGFLGNTLSIMKKINRNVIAHKLFQHIQPGRSILDLGAGRGADIMMWKRKNLNVYAVEPDRINYNKLVQKKSIYNIHTLNAKGQENQKIIDFVPKNGIDYIIMIYSLTFFFEDNKTLDGLIALISTLLKPGGLFIGTVMDGNKLLSWAKKSGKKKSGYVEIDCHPFIIKIYNKHKVFINIDDPVSLVHDQLEYLIDFDLFKKKLKRIGITLLETGFLDKEAEILNKCPRWFTSINRYFIFKKISELRSN